ncbi:MAG: hypothetical protein FWB97_10900 [Oscillospiraceae bacterium]|nr:hypothetical protein [Oscillospiraceae bacterium]
MSKKTRKMTLSALFAALTVILLYIASVWPTGRFGLVAAASLFAAAAVVEAGLGSGFAVFAVSAAIGMLIVPNRAAPLLYIFFFGYYPMVKSLIERVKGTVLQWVLKLVVFNAALTAIWFLFGELLVGFLGYGHGALIAYLGGNVAFVLFDYGFTKLIWFYIDRISKKVRV